MKDLESDFQVYFLVGLTKNMKKLLTSFHGCFLVGFSGFFSNNGVLIYGGMSRESVPCA